MKKLISGMVAAAVVALSVGSAGAETLDKKEYAINLTGSVASLCVMTPNGSTTKTVDMANTGNQVLLGVAYSCNSPYKLTVASKNGGMKHQSGTFTIPYDLETNFLSSGGAKKIAAASMASAPVLVDSVATWNNVLTLAQAGLQTGNIDLAFPDASKYAVAGKYDDTITITLAADF